jgi:hypothetical protein
MKPCLQDQTYLLIINPVTLHDGSVVRIDDVSRLKHLAFSAIAGNRFGIVSGLFDASFYCFC